MSSTTQNGDDQPRDIVVVGAASGIPTFISANASGDHLRRDFGLLAALRAHRRVLVLTPPRI